MKRQRRLPIMAVAAAVGILLAGAEVVGATGPGIRLEAAAADDGTWRLQARVTGVDGAPQSQVTVRFMAATVFVGERWVPIGDAVTDTSGTATVLYTPTWNGEQELVARVSGAEGVGESDPVFIQVGGALPGVDTEPEELPVVRVWALPIGAAVVVVVWIVLAFLFLSAVIGIARQRSNPQADGGSNT